jgi:hypothetical protein
MKEARAVRGRLTLLACSLALGGLLVGAPSGCSSPRYADDASAEEGPPTPVKPPERFDPYPVVQVRKVLIEGALAGYMKVRVDDTQKAKQLLIFLVYDESFALRGYFTENGRTFLATRDGDSKYMGARTREDSLRLLLDGERDTEVTLVPMDKPKSIR